MSENEAGDIGEQRWKHMEAVSEAFRKEMEYWREQAKHQKEQFNMLQDCLQTMMETTGRGVIRVEFRLTKEKNLFILASSSKDQMEHLAALVAKCHVAFTDAALETMPDPAGDDDKGEGTTDA